MDGTWERSGGHERALARARCGCEPVRVKTTHPALHLSPHPPNPVCITRLSF